MEKRIVVIGGGTGTFTVLSGLKYHPVHLTAIVSMADDGGSTGVLRDQYGVLPPGDIRRALVALSESGPLLRDLFNYRFRSGSLKNHSFGNLFLAALEKMTGDFGEAVDEAAAILRIKGSVIPVTLDNVRLIAKLTDGSIVKGEANIDIPGAAERAAITSIWLAPRAALNPKARQAIQEAHMIVIGPGDLYTSIIPNLLVAGMPEALRRAKAKKVYIANIMTKYGETHSFDAALLFETLERYLGSGAIGVALWNGTKPPHALLLRYKKERAEFIDPKTLAAGLRGKTKHVRADLLAAGRLIRHDPRKLAKALMNLW